MQELQAVKQISVFPNPTSDNVFINIRGELPTEIQIKSIDGVVLHRLSSVTESNVINISSLQSGLYIVSIVFADRVVEEKILKQNK
ncbi:MAG: T9SS type A sorting domain-containing protein [Bacteroidales bacterium]|nr:T9SS type A sorting domain-containing protein [Bacteroidales bacterium]